MVAKLPFEGHTPGAEFKSVQLDDNPTTMFKIGANLTPTVENDLIECLRANAELFACSSEKMLGIDPSVACHKLNVNPEAKPMSQKRRHQSPEKAQTAREIL